MEQCALPLRDHTYALPCKTLNSAEAAIPPLVQRLSCSTAGAELHLLPSDAIDVFGYSETVFTDAADISSLQVEVESNTTEVDDTKCANCTHVFPQKKKPDKGLVRYSLKCLDISDTLLSQSGNFVCSSCRSYLSEQKKLATKTSSNNLFLPIGDLGFCNFIDPQAAHDSSPINDRRPPDLR